MSRGVDCATQKWRKYTLYILYYYKWETELPWSTSRFMLCTMLCIHFAPKSLPSRCHFPFVPTVSFQAAEGLFLYPAMNRPALKISVPLFNTFGLTRVCFGWEQCISLTSLCVFLSKHHQLDKTDESNCRSRLQYSWNVFIRNKVLWKWQCWITA